MLIPKNKLKAALLHAGDRDIRFYLNGVRVEYDGEGELLLIGTSGSALFAGRIAVDSETTPAFALTIPRDSLKAALATGKDVYLDLRPDGAASRIGDVMFTPIDGKFPEWQRVVPRVHEPVADALYRWDQLELTRKSLALWHGKRDCYPTIVRQSQDGSGVATAVNSSAFVVIMPLRPEKIERPQPFL
jgi:hypothetical protein